MNQQLTRVLWVLIGLLTISGCRFGEVEKGQVYRMEQPSREQLVEIHKHRKIGTIINLRGENRGLDWYDVEEEFARSNGIQLVNISMSAKFLPMRKKLIRLLDALESAPKPLLIHCKAGVDRTGEASTIYQMLHMGFSKEKALKMLSAEHGYVDGISPKSKKYFIKELWQGEEWARNEYFPCESNYKYVDHDQCNSLRAQGQLELREDLISQRPNN